MSDKHYHGLDVIKPSVGMYFIISHTEGPSVGFDFVGRVKKLSSRYGKTIIHVEYISYKDTFDDLSKNSTEIQTKEWDVMQQTKQITFPKGRKVRNLYAMRLLKAD